MRLKLAEYTLAGLQEPDQAAQRFTDLAHSLPVTHAYNGLARVGLGYAQFRAGRYRESEATLTDLLRSKARGYDRRRAAFMLAHAKKCRKYHDERARAGITEPGFIDPLSGAAGVAYAARAAGQPAPTQTETKAKVPHTGFGSTTKQLIEGCDAFGLDAASVKASPAGLRALLAVSEGMPVIVRVEMDHFVTVVEADAKGLKYLCVDCGPWPGGYRRVSWKQWQMLDPDRFIATAKPDSPYAKALALLPEDSSGVTMATHSSQADAVQRIVAALTAARVTLFPTPYQDGFSGVPAMSLVCDTPGDCPPSEIIGPFCPIDMAAAGLTGRGPSAGEPVNLSIGAENYAPPSMLSIYNPVGPAIHWGHSYHTLARPTPNGYGQGWYHPYLFTIVDSYDPNALIQPDATSDIIFPNSFRLSFNNEDPPTAQAPTKLVFDGGGYPMRLEWKFDPIMQNRWFEATFRNREKLIFTTAHQPTSGKPKIYYLSKITNATGQSVSLNWEIMTFDTYNTITHSYTGMALTSIVNDASTTLLSLSYDQGKIVSATDCYARSVTYLVENFFHTNPQGPPAYSAELTQVSKVNSPHLRYRYHYQNVNNGNGAEMIPFLQMIDAPSAATPGPNNFETATISYSSLGFVTSVMDANGNRRHYIEVPNQNATKVVVKDANNVDQLVYSVTWDVKFNPTSMSTYVDSNPATPGQVAWEAVYADPGCPFRPTSVTVKGTNKTSTFTWDQYCNLLTSTTPKGTQTTYTYSYNIFPLGRLEWVQEGTKSATTLAYYEPSGLLQSVTSPRPGTSGSTQTVTTSYQYDTLGNVTQIDAPGNSTVSVRTTTLNYGPTPKVGQALTITDSLGKQTLVQYDARANVTQVTDRVGNVTNSTYDDLDNPLTVLAPATGMTGTGRSWVQYEYQYLGGPLKSTKAYDESNVNVRTTNLTYGKEGELLLKSGDTESVSIVYDGQYRTKQFKDGNNNVTNYLYNPRGYLAKVEYPGKSGSTFDQIQYTSYDDGGHLLSMTDGRGIVTNYEYLDGDGSLSGVLFPGSPSQNVSITYDVYG
ncbi:MAG TPA: hypothetical protein PLH94_10040, partial [Fimbriimonadaceae bacterium]|nr:hypothetical protein [Fimbriimonadaceae bacterium]